jgi:uncharacterized protein YutE (UPF0331/DUF86 family)
MQRFIGLNRELYWPRDAHAQAKPLFDPWLFDDLHDWYDNYPHDTENVKDIAEYRSRCFKYKLKIESCLLTIATTVDPTILSGAHLKKRKTLDVIIKLLLKNGLLNRDQESKIREVIGICNRGRHIENKIDPNDVKLLYQNGREALDLLYALSSQAVESMLDAAAKLPKDKR